MSRLAFIPTTRLYITSTRILIEASLRKAQVPLRVPRIESKETQRAQKF